MKKKKENEIEDNECRRTSDIKTELRVILILELQFSGPKLGSLEVQHDAIRVRMRMRVCVLFWRVFTLR